MLVEFQDSFKARKYFTKQNIENGNIRNPYEPSLCGVGMLGEMSTPTSHPLYHRWADMIGRCYNENHPSYSDYGQKEIMVSDEWKIFTNYVRDLEKMQNYEEMIKNPQDYQIDKDLLGKKFYSKETCLIIKTELNIAIRNKDNSKKISQYSKSEKFIAKYSSCKEAAESIGRHPSGISDCISGKQKTCGGFIWSWDMD